MIEQTFDISGPADLDISVPAGSLVIESGPTGRVSVSIDTKSPDFWQVAASGNAVTVSHERSFMGGGRARVRVVCPDGSSLRAAVASADLRATLSLENLTVSNASGDVTLGDVGTLSVKAASGDVRIAHVRGDLDVRSASGDVRVSRVDGSVAVTTASGDVTIDEAAGSMSSSSASGDMRVDRYLGNDIKAATMSGRIDIGLPAGVGVKLSANSLSGRIQLPERRPTTSGSDRQISVRLKSVSGDIRIRRVD